MLNLLYKSEQFGLTLFFSCVRDKTTDFRGGQNRRFVIIQIAKIFAKLKVVQDKSVLAKLNYQYPNKLVLLQNTKPKIMKPKTPKVKKVLTNNHKIFQQKISKI